MLTRSYSVKIYDKDLVFKRTINNKILTSAISIQKAVGFGDGRYTIETSEAIEVAKIFDASTADTTTEYTADSTTFYTADETNGGEYEIGDIVKVIEESISGGVCVFFWAVENVIVAHWDGAKVVSIETVGVASVLSKLRHEETGGNYEFTVNQDPSTTITDLLVTADNEYWYFDPIGIASYGSSLSIDVKNDSLMDTIKAISKETGRVFYVGSNGEVVFEAKGTGDEHVLSIWGDAHEVYIERRGDFYNSCRVVYNNEASETTYQDAESIATHWLRQSPVIINDDITTLAAATERAKQEINAGYSVVGVVVSPSYIYENINLNDTIKITWLPFTIEALRVVSITYWESGASLKLWEAISAELSE